jgi:hypothetical protein
VEAGVQRIERTDYPALFIGELSKRIGKEPENLQVKVPNLEQVYLQLIAEHRNGVKIED